MPGHVFHPGHQELHGVTVVLETRGSRTYLGRFDREDAHGVHLLNVGVHDATNADLSKDDYVRRAAKFGIRTDQRHLIVPSDEVERITPLGEVAVD